MVALLVTVTAPVAPETLIPVPATIEVTPLFAIVIDPEALVIPIAVPAVKVVLVNPVPFPISKAPFAGVLVSPVPPFPIGRVPVTPVDSGRPVTLVITPLAGVPRAGVINVGLVANTNEPDPVSSVTAAAKLAEVGVASQVATPVPSPVIDPMAGVTVVLPAKVN